LRISVILIDAATGRYLWADRWDGDGKDLFGFEERVALRVATAIQPSLREAEIDRAWRQDPARLNAWELTMRALPRVSSGEPAAQGLALELLERAIEQAPSDPLPMALAAFCHGLRGCHNFCRRPDEERAVARVLAAQAAQLTTGDALTESLLAAGYTLAHDLTTAAIHADKALAFDGGSSWAWGRSGFIKAYRGEAEEAIERFQIARALAPSDRINFLWDVGIASGHFDAARYDESTRWCERALVENPAAVSINKTMAAAFTLAGRKNDARRSVAELGRVFPDLTIAQIRSGLPFRAAHLDRMAEGLESAGMRRG
jgi:adenylate cyclase